MNKLKRFLLISLAPIALLSITLDVQAQATDVECDQCISASDIKARAVVTGKLRNQAVTSAKLANDAVGTLKLKNGAVTTDKLDSEVKSSIADNANGFAYSTVGSNVNVTSTSYATAASVTITVPSAGTIKVDYSTYVQHPHTTGTTSLLECHISTTDNSSSGSLTGSRRFHNYESPLPSASYWFNASTRGVFVAPEPGTYSFYMVCRKGSQTGDPGLRSSNMTATFHAASM